MKRIPPDDVLYDVYAFVHPLDLRVCYVGITNDMERRRKQHEAKQPWIHEMQAKGLDPIMIKLEPNGIRGYQKARLYEVYWIGKLSSGGHHLHNIAGNPRRPITRAERFRGIRSIHSEEQFFQLSRADRDHILALNAEGMRRFGFNYAEIFTHLFLGGIHNIDPIDEYKHWYEIAAVAFCLASIPTILDEDKKLLEDCQTMHRLIIEEGMDDDEAMAILADLDHMEVEEEVDL